MSHRPSIVNASSRHDRLLNVQRVRELLQCSRSHVYNLVDNGTLVAIKIGKVRGIRIYESSVERLLGSLYDPNE